jgi:hypothetical protein
VAFELVLVLRLVHRMSLENAAFRQVLSLAAAGFVVNHFLPLRLRLGFFVALSGVSLAVALGSSMSDPGAGLANAAWLAGICLALVGICHLPLRYWTRISILLCVGTAWA